MLDAVFNNVRRGLYALLSLAAGGLVAGVTMLAVSLLGGPSGLFVGLAALILWPIGMVCLGGPVWAILHGLGRRRVSDARIAGGIGGGLSVFVVALMLFGPGGAVWLVVALLAAGILSGVVGGSVVWTMAYGAGHVTRA